MKKFEYKAIPAPSTGTKAKGLKSTEERFALSVTELLNEMAEEGWEYVRAETLPCDERKGLTGTQTTFQNLLIFRRFEAEPLALAGHAQRVVSEPLRPVASRPAPDLRAVSEPRPPMPEPAPPAPVAQRSESEPVLPRRLSARMPGEGAAPPLGAARDD